MRRRICIASMLLLSTACSGLAETDLAGRGGRAAGGTKSNGTAGAGDAGLGGAAGAIACTSKTFWTEGDNGSENMHPGGTCLACHAMNPAAPIFAAAGTVYPTLHEVNECNGANGTAGINIVITDAARREIAVPVNSVGNFHYQGDILAPFNAKVVANGKHYAMIDPPPSGDCNSCHTQQGINAPGRILAP